MCDFSLVFFSAFFLPNLHSAKLVAVLSINKLSMLPILIVTGFLGSGKTTLLQRALAQRESFLGALWMRGRLLLVVNDFASENIDAVLLQPPPEAFATVRESEKSPTVGLSGGCVCCNLLPALLQHLRRAAASTRYDFVVLELTGLADPVSVVGAILCDPQLASSVIIDAVVCVVDAAGYTIGTDPLGGAQLVGANVIVANKWSLAEEKASRSDLDTLEASLRTATRNSAVRFYPTDYCNVALDDLVIGRSMFAQHGCSAIALSRYTPPSSLLRDVEEESGHIGDVELAREMETIGARSFVYSISSQPDAGGRYPRLSAVLDAVRVVCGKEFGVWRSKGFFFAFDDVEPNGGLGKETPEVPPRAKHFRWSSVHTQFEYNEVLFPPIDSPRKKEESTQRRIMPTLALIVFIGSHNENSIRATLRSVFPPGDTNRVDGE
jgi:G3E family GTPase